MRKIPTVFKRDPENRKTVLSEVTPGCEWVLAGEGVPTRKYDGTCCMFDGTVWWTRREVKPGKEIPPNWLHTESDPTTGKAVGWEPAAQSGFAKWLAEAVANYATDNGQDPESGTYELCGPKVNGNPEGLDEHHLIPHAYAEEVQLPEPSMRSFEDARRAVVGLGDDGWEGIVWHHPDGRMAKLKARDFQRSSALPSSQAPKETR